MYLLLVLLILSTFLTSCATATPSCPPDVQTCDITVAPPPMSYAELSYYQNNPTTRPASLTQDILDAMILQDILYRRCFDCYGPTYYTRYGSYSSYPAGSSQVRTVVQNNTTVIQRNTTVINQAKSTVPASARSVSPPAQKNTTNGQNGGTGGGAAATNKGSSPSAPVNQSRPSAPSSSSSTNR